MPTYISIAINGVESKFTLLSSAFVLLYAVLAFIGAIVVVATGPGPDNRYYVFILHTLLLVCAVGGAFTTQEQLNWLVRTHAHRAVVCAVSTVLIIAQGEAQNMSEALPFVVIGSLFFLGNVFASIASCVQHDRQEDLLVTQDSRTRSLSRDGDAKVAPSSSSSPPSRSLSVGEV